MDVESLCLALDGMFSFVLLDESTTPPRIIAARDPIGITTLYKGTSSSYPSRVYFASELKALVDDCDDIISFPPGHVFDSATGKTTRYFTPSWWNGDDPSVPSPTNAADYSLIRETLEAAVRKRLMSEVPYGVLLSGGLDSSLIASIAVRETEKIALAQFESKKKRLAKAAEETCVSSGVAPLVDGDEKGKLFISSFFRIALSVLNPPYRDSCILATSPFVQYWPPLLSRSSRRTQSSGVHRDRTP